MGFFKKIFKAALPIIGAVAGNALLPGIGGAIGGAIGGGVNGGGLQGAALGGLGGYLGTGGLGSVPESISWAANPARGLAASTQTLSGSGLLGALSGLSPSLANGLSSLASSAGNMGGLSLLGNTYSALAGSNAADKAAGAQSAYAQKALELQNPFYASGLAANTQLSGLLGLNGEDPNNIMEILRGSPGYQFRLQEGTKGLNRSLAAQGGLLSGNAMRESMKLGQGLADQTYNDYVDQLYRQTGVGTNAANQMGSTYQDLGNISANKTMAKQDALNKGLAGILSGSYGFGQNTPTDPNELSILKKYGYA
jgi:hypothetical protein